MEIEEKNAYKEVIEVLKHVEKEELEKIPKERIKFFEENMNKDYEFKIDETKNFEEQNLMEKTKIILAIIFRDYWATEAQKEKIIAKENYDIQMQEKQKEEKYSYDNLFDKKEEQTLENIPQENNEELGLVDYNSNNKWYMALKEFISKIWKKILGK